MPRPWEGFVRLQAALSSIARSGWMMRGIPPGMAETVAAHTAAAALLAIELAWEAWREDPKVSPERAAALAVVHDVAEAWVGDIPRPAGVEGKEEAEMEAVQGSMLSEKAKLLYREFTEASSLEAVIARVAEKLATYTMALHYRSLGYPVDDIIESSLREALANAERAGLAGALRRMVERLGIPLEPPRPSRG